MISEGLFSHLSAAGGVTNLVGKRIYPLVVPQHVAGEVAKMPCVVYARVDVRRQQKFCGTDGLVRSVFQLDSYATTYHESITLAAAVRAALVDYAGTMGTVPVQKVFLDYQDELTEPDPGLYRVMQRFILWHDEP